MALSLDQMPVGAHRRLRGKPVAIIRRLLESQARPSAVLAFAAAQGLATPVRGVLHLLIGWIALQVACCGSGRSADQSGALRTLAGSGLGRLTPTHRSGSRNWTGLCACYVSRRSGPGSLWRSPSESPRTASTASRAQAMRASKLESGATVG